ncbi:MAG: hypothetical protein E4H27_00180 [Anaerolineales bacterium]|nr:MAG: hypothetical protein E4H27_00180 [Anaerolineales bacterium]
MNLYAQWLIHGATDLIRVHARWETTQVLKVAYSAELHGTRIELNGQGALFGLVHAHLECCIDNTDCYAYFGSETADRNLQEGQQWALRNQPTPQRSFVLPSRKWIIAFHSLAP